MKDGNGMDKRKEPYIEQQKEEDALYTRLQRQTLKETQRLAGNVWTDYNVHDPGVTLADIANYALTELDYKASFETEDYLTEETHPFDAKRFGLFPPTDIYTTLPVTEDDYRRMLTENIPELDNAQVICNPETGGYTFRIVLSPFAEGSAEQIKQQVATAYQSRRNLGEWLEKVEVIEPDRLDFEAELEIGPGEDATDILASIYRCILRYLSGDAKTSLPTDYGADTSAPEVWLEGSENIRHVVLPELTNTEYELYKRLRNIKGITRFQTCYLMKDGIPQTRFQTVCSLHIPATQEAFGKIRIRCGKRLCSIDPARFLERLKGFYLVNGHASTHLDNPNEASSYWPQPTGTWHNVYEHYPIANDFPDCYRLTPKATQVSPFETYTRLYDWVIRNSLEELKALPRLLSLDPEDEDSLSNRNRLGLKSRYLDFLDKLYGVESHPAWLSEMNCYGETPAGTVRRRTNFLHQIAQLQKTKAKARNLIATQADTPTVKAHFCLLLGLNPDDGNTVSNVLPVHNLRLMEYRKEKAEDKGNMTGIADRIDSLLIEEQMLKPNKVQPVKFVLLSKDKEGRRKEYAEMRASLAFFNENLITGDLFRGGTSLDNYKIVTTPEDTYLLIYRHQERGGWTNLGQDTETGRLERLANILRRFLRELNRKSETLYVVEPVLADKTRAFEVILVLPAWTYRFHSPRFRDKCRELLRSIVPAHLSGKVCWIGEREMRKFELCYHHLMRTFTDSRLAEYRGNLLEAIDGLMENAEEKQDLDDTD